MTSPPWAREVRRRVLAGAAILGLGGGVGLSQMGDPTVVVAAGTLPAALTGTPVTIAWGGDLTLGSSYGLPPDHGRTLLASVTGLLRGADIATVNLEGTFGTGGAGKCDGLTSPDCFSFQAPPANASALPRAGVDLVNLANNHAFDFGAAGMGDTVAALRDNGVATTGRPGETTTVRRARTSATFLGFAAYPWASPIRDLPRTRALVAQAALRHTAVVVLMHAGAEGAGATHTPHAEEVAFGEARGNARAFAHAAIDAGADLVLGSGPHVLRGMEIYRGCLIAYSLGNLAGFRNFSIGGAGALSGLLRVTLAADGSFAEGSLTSLRLNRDGIPRRDPSAAAAALVSRLSRADFGTRAVTIGADGTLTLPAGVPVREPAPARLSPSTGRGADPGSP